MNSTVLYNIKRENNLFSIKKEGKLLYSLKRSNTTFYSYCSLYDSNGKLLFKYYYVSFFCYVKVKILFQNLSKRIRIISKFSTYDFFVENNSYHIDLTISPFSKNVGGIYLNEAKVGDVKYNSEGIIDNYEANLKMAESDSCYAIICLLIYLTDIDGDI